MENRKEFTEVETIIADLEAKKILYWKSELYHLVDAINYGLTHFRNGIEEQKEEDRVREK